MLRTLALLAALLLAVVPLMLLVAGQAGLLSGTRPARLGVIDGALQPVRSPQARNEVNSRAETADHRIAPIAFASGDADGTRTWARLREALRAAPGVAVVRDDGRYLHAECTTRWLKFTDDLELLRDPAAGVVHLRSASRLGSRDFGVNRARIEALRAAVAR